MPQGKTIRKDDTSKNDKSVPCMDILDIEP